MAFTITTRDGSTLALSMRDVLRQLAPDATDVNDEVVINGRVCILSSCVETGDGGGAAVQRLTGAQAAALVPVGGDLVYITATNGVFASRGFYGYVEGQGWQQF
jgi:hypothetical protein